MMGWQWHQLDHMQIICTSLQTDKHAIISPLSLLFTCWMPLLLPNQQCQSTEGTNKIHNKMQFLYVYIDYYILRES